MQPAEDLLREAVANIEIRDPRLPVYMNAEKRRRACRKAADVRRFLPKQPVSTLFWEQTMATVFNGYEAEEHIPVAYECGGQGGQLTAMLAKVNGKAAKKAFCV